MQDFHQPVMSEEIKALFSDLAFTPKNYLDGTFGRGGHSSILWNSHPEIQIWALDQDLESINYCENQWKKNHPGASLHMVHSNFCDLPSVVESKGWPDQYDFILLDLGVSSPQLDVSQRGFSFYKDGPLDMRMNRNQELDAATIVNEWSSAELHQIFQELGEVRRPGRVIRAIVNDRQSEPFRSTMQLSSLIERVDGWKRKGKHPATNYFMALRLRVNRELDVLEKALPIMVNFLSPKGRMAVLSFHSLEDRIVKYFFRDCPLGQPLSKKVMKPTRDELLTNRRSRSALLRCFEKFSGEDILEERQNGK